MTARDETSILIVEDDRHTRAFLQATFSDDAFRVHEARHTNEAMVVLAEHDEIDLIILDVELPDRSGLEMLRELRATDAAHRQLPVVVLSAHGDVEDRVVGLRSGADDYVPKPAHPKELRARVDAVLRRARRKRRRPPPTIIVSEELTIDTTARVVTLSGSPVPLTPIEHDLLTRLATRPSEAVSRDELLHLVWGEDAWRHDPSVVTEHVRKLRDKLSTPERPCRWITTLRGVGYRFDLDP